MDRLLIVPLFLISILVLLISLSAVYPYFVSMKIEISNTSYYYNILCFRLNITDERIFGCYYIVNITKIKIQNYTFNTSYSFNIYTNFVSKTINIIIPNKIAENIVNYPNAKVTIYLKVEIISSVNTKIERNYDISSIFNNNYLEYAKTI